MFPPLRVGGRDGPAPPRSLFSLAFTTQMIVTTPVSQSFSQASQPGHVFDASSTGGHCCCCALGTVRWLPLELATAHCYGNCWRPQQPPPQGGGERAGVLRNSKTKHRTVKAAKNHCCPELNFAGSTNVSCLFVQLESLDFSTRVIKVIDGEAVAWPRGCVSLSSVLFNQNDANRKIKKQVAAPKK